MKIVTASLVWLVLGAGVFAADEKPAASVAPQPRVRLALTPQGAVARAEPPPKAETDAVMMDKVTVAGSRVSPPAKAAEPEPTKFSLLRGGPVVEGKIGTLPFAVGAWAWTDLFPEDAKFRSQKVQAEWEFFRLKW